MNIRRASLGVVALAAFMGTPAAQESRPGPQRQEPNRGGEIDLASMDPNVALQRLKVADGYEVNLFASEREFPELGKAVAAKFDARGRLWVSTAPTYPHQVPGVKPNDKILILDDTNRDGRADKLAVFADDLYLPIGFELGDGGVYVNQQPNLMFLRDTNGDDKADERTIILHGFGTEDSHHAIHAFTWSPGGTLHFQEGTFLHSQVETPYGPVRVDYGAVWEYEPRSEKLSVFVTYPFANPWGHVIDRWGQNFVSDASNGNNHFGTAFSGHVDYPNKSKRMKEWTTGIKMRPTADVTLVSSRQFPDDAQGNFLVTNVIGFQGIKQYRVSDDGSGFLGTEVEPLIQSTDPNFRPVDMEFGPDGALYVVDWINPLIGHMQYSMRDPRRDKVHGRIWRITAKGRPLVDPPKIAGQSIEAQLDLLKAYEDMTRYRARRALREQPRDAVVAALGKWVSALDTADKDYEHHLLEALWVYQHNDVVQQDLLGRLLQAKDFRARAAAVRVLQHWLDRVPDSLGLLQRAVNDPAPRVRLEAVRALSFVPTKEAANVALEVLKQPLDYYLDYVLDGTMTALEKAWKPALMTDTSLDTREPRALGYLLGRIAPAELSALRPSRVGYQAVLARPDVDRASRQAALDGLARLNGRSGPPAVVEELIGAIDRVDGTPGSSEITRDLAQMLIASDPAPLAANASALERLARRAKNHDVAEGALVALLRAEPVRSGASNLESTVNSVDRVWQFASASPRNVIALFAAAPLMPEPTLTALYPSIERALSEGPGNDAASTPNSPAPVMGRYVRVLLPGRESLTLAEVQVFSGGENVAAKGTASQSSTVSGRMGSGPARYATDGRTEGDGQGAGLSITSQERDPWWEIDLGREMPIDAVTIWSPMRSVGGAGEDDYRAVETRANAARAAAAANAANGGAGSGGAANRGTALTGAGTTGGATTATASTGAGNSAAGSAGAPASGAPAGQPANAGAREARNAPRPAAFHVTVLDASRKPTFMADGFTLTPPSLTVALGGNLTTEVRKSALTALSYVRGNDDAIFSRLVGFIRPMPTRLAALDALRRRPRSNWPAAQMAPLAETLVAAARETPPADRTGPAFVQTLALAREIAEQMPAADQQRIGAALQALAVKTITIEAVASQMKFDTPSFTVEPGQEVEIVFVNRDEMPHNLLFTAPGKLETVSLAAEAMVAQPDAFSKSFIPPSKDVLWSTPLVNPRDTARLRFTAPSAPDRYPFVCTFPGHWRTMNGVMLVAKPPTSSARARGVQ